MRPLRSGELRAQLIAAAAAVGGVLILLSTLPVLTEWLGRFTGVIVPFGLRVTSHVAAVLIGVALLYLAGQLDRRKLLAWRITVVLFAVSVWFNLTRAHHPVAVGYSLFMVVLLVFTRDEFRAPADPPTLFDFGRWIVIWLAAVLAYGMAALYLEGGHLVPEPTFVDNLQTILLGLVGVDGAYTYQQPVFGDLFSASLLALGVGGAAVALALLFRPLVAQPVAGPDDWEHATRLVRSYGDDTLAYFALRDDKLFFFSRDGEAMIAYTYLGRYALASGDPIGAPDAIPRVLDEFIEMCDAHAWGAAFLAVREADRQLYVDRGLKTFYLGDEAVVACEGFSLEGKRWKSVRQSANRVARTFSFAFMKETDASPELIDALNDLSRKWRGRAPERGFTMSLSQDVEGRNPDFHLCVALDDAGRPGGFLRIVPVYGASAGFTLDLMRRDPDAPNGMTEFLLTRTIATLDELGYRRLSLNFAAWGRLFSEETHPHLADRIARSVLEVLSPFFQIKSLKEFNQRFHPEWVPRMIAYDDRRSLPRIGVLFGGVEGFLHLPVVGRYLLPKTVAHPGRPVPPLP